MEYSKMVKISIIDIEGGINRSFGDVIEAGEE